MGKKGGHLKSALQSQQSRLKNKQKLEHAAQVVQAKAKKQHRQQEQAALASTSKSLSSKGSSTTASHPSAIVKGKGKEKHVQPTQRPIIPFKPTDRILLVGEGNFSFTRALIFHPPSPSLVSLPPANVTATAYDKEEECYEKYADAREIVKELAMFPVN